MKCLKCGNEFDQELERQAFNMKTHGEPTYDEMGLMFTSTCQKCHDEADGKLINEARRCVNDVARNQ